MAGRAPHTHEGPRQDGAALSRAASALLAAHRHDAEVAQDLAAFYAPQECYGDVDWQTERLDEVVAPFGFESVEQFERECRARGLPDRWICHLTCGL